MKKIIQFIIFTLIGLLLNIYQSFKLMKKLKIGLIVPLSGEYKEIGNSILKATTLAINKINDSRIEIVPRDTESNPETTLKISKELEEKGIKIIIGPVFNKNLVYLDELNEVTFLSLSNIDLNNPKNVISGGINAISQIRAIKKFQETNKLERSILLIPNNEIKMKLKMQLKKQKLNLKINLFMTQIQLINCSNRKIDKIQTKKTKFEDEIKRLENSNEDE